MPIKDVFESSVYNFDKKNGLNSNLLVWKQQWNNFWYWLIWLKLQGAA